MEDLEREIVASLGHGDHHNLDRMWLRGILGLGVLAARAFSGGTVLWLPDAAILHVVASPVAHGARLTEAVGEALAGTAVVRIADQRLSTVPVDVHAPSVGMRSIRDVTNRRTLAGALALRRRADAQAIRALSRSRIYAEYLFLAQAIRYQTAIDALAEADARTVVLTDFDRHAYSRPWVWAANRHGLRTITMVHGSPNRNYVPVLSGTVLTWGERQSEWFHRHSPEAATVIIGRPEVATVSRPPTPLERVIICHSKEDLTEAETTGLVDVVTTLRTKGISTTVRLHPSAHLDRLDAQWTRVVESADAVTQTRDSFTAGLNDGDGVLCVTSTSAVEAVIAGVPVAVLADPERELPADLETLRTEDPVTVLLSAPQRGELVAATGAEAAELLAREMSAITAH